MLIEVPDVLSPAQVAKCRAHLDTAKWVDGRSTAGPQAVNVKTNRQLPPECPTARDVGAMILESLRHHPVFLSAALPKHILPPMFNRYSGGQEFGTHVDNAIRQLPGQGLKMRTDVSATLFFSEPEEYDGGELCIEDTYGVKRVKLPAGHMIMYPSTSLHSVTPVTRGVRVCSVFWVQSMIRSDECRSLLFDLDTAIQRLRAELPENQAAAQSALQLTGVYHNLLRHWAEL